MGGTKTMACLKAKAMVKTTVKSAVVTADIRHWLKQRTLVCNVAKHLRRQAGQLESSHKLILANSEISICCLHLGDGSHDHFVDFYIIY